MENRPVLFGLCLMIAACADTAQPARPNFQASNEGARTIASDPYHEGKHNLAAGQYGLAVERFMAAYRRNPYDIDVLNALGVIYDHLGRRDLAFRYFERALALDTFSPMTLNNLGRCWMNDGNWRHAIDYLERAEKMDDSNGQIAANLRTANIEAARTWAANSTRVRAATGMRIERQNSVVQVLYTRPDEQRPERPGLIEESEKFSAPSSFGPHPGAPDENAASEAVASGNGAVVRRRTPDRRGS